MKTTAQIFATKLVDFGLRFAASVIIARYLGPSDKGVLTFATVVIGWTVMFGNLSLTDAAVYLVGRRSFSPSQVTAVSLLFSAIAGGVYVGVLWGVARLELVHLPAGDPRVLYLFLALIPIQLATINLTSVIQGLSQFRAYNLFTIARSALLLLCIAGAVWLARDRLMGIAHATLWSAAAGMVLILVYVLRASDWRPRPSAAYLKEALHFGLRGHLSVILENINMRFDQLVLGAMINPTELGWYSIAVGICEMPHLLPDSIGVVLYPRVAGNQATAGRLTARACRITLALMIVVSIALVLVATPAIRLVYGAAFVPAVKPLVILAPSLVFLSVSKILTKYIYGVGRPHWVVWATVLSSSVTLCLIFPLVRRYGMVGAALTSTIAYGVGALCNLVLTVKLSHTPAQEFLVPKWQDLQAVWAHR